ncbi:metal-dependent hydrolase, partial [Acinetobacter baumannii]
SPQLEAEIRAFIRQEINHTREHIVFNKAAVDAGYDLDRIDKRVEDMLALTKDRPAIINLAATMALEHYTAMMAHEFLANPAHFAGAEPE